MQLLAGMSTTFGYALRYVADVPATLDFPSTAFRIQQRFVTPEGHYGELATGSTALAFRIRSASAEANLRAAGGFSPGRCLQTPPPAVSITLITHAAASALAAASRAGGAPDAAPTNKPWFQDCCLSALPKRNSRSF